MAVLDLRAMIEVRCAVGWQHTRVLATIHSPVAPDRPLPHIVRHSPTGFGFGYAGSGPADLALSILTACVGPELADRWYQTWKFKFVAPAKPEGFCVKVRDVCNVVEHWEQGRKGVPDGQDQKTAP